MKPLACEPGSGSHKNSNVNSDMKSFKANFHLIGFMRTAENTEHKSWFVIAAPTPTELLISRNIEKEKSAIYDKPEILLVPVDKISEGITIENFVRVDGKTFTSGKSDNFHSPAMGISISHVERAVFIDLMKNITNNFANRRTEKIEQGNGKESKRLEILKGENEKDESCWELITIGNDKLLGSTTERGKAIKTKSERSELCNPQSNDWIHERNKSNAELGSDFEESGSEIENYLQQIISIELKPNPRKQDNSMKYKSGDLLRFKFKVTIPEAENCNHQIEIDLVKSFQCKAVSPNACGGRQIRKVLKRSIMTELKWERAIHISGQQFSLVWILYKIPDLTDDEILTETETQNGGNTEDKLGSPEEPSDKFRVSDCLYVLQVRLYEKVSNPGREEDPDHNVLAACSSFPLGGIEKAKTVDTCDDENSPMSGLHTSEDYVQAFSGVGYDNGETETKKLFENMPIIKKSLSATEFDV